MLSLSLRSASRNPTRRLFSTSQTRTAAGAAKRPSKSPSQQLPRHDAGRRTVLRLTGLAALVGGGAYYTLSGEDDDALTSALRAYIVYSVCSFPWVVDHAPGVLDMLLSIPVASSITEAVIRHTFFAQFVGAESATDCLPLLHRLRERNIGALFAYSVEVQDPTKGEHAGAHKQTHKHMVEEMIRSIDVAADFEASRRGNGSHDGKDRNELLGPVGRRTWVAVKITALAPDSSALIRLSRHILQHRPASMSSVPFPGTPDASDLRVLDFSPSPNNMDAHGHDSPDSSPDVGILTAQDIASLRELRENLVRICTRAEERGVRIIIDAEYSWYQPAIDAFCYDLMRKFNAKPWLFSSSFSALQRFFGVNTAATTADVQPLVYATYQAYLRRTPEHLKHSIRDAKKHGYTLGVKLVRGAYHPHELSMHGHSSSSNSSVGDSHAQSISPEPLPPVWVAKPETDACYNACASVLVGELAAITRSRFSTPSSSAVGVLFGTHNTVSCDHILKSLVQTGLAKEEIVEEAKTTTEGEHQGKGDNKKKIVRLGDDVGERVTFGQLYGMHDELAEKLLECTRANAPVLIKYVPYGALTEVMPYLSRRAIENKSVLGNGAAETERRRAGKEIRKILFGSWA